VNCSRENRYSRRWKKGIMSEARDRKMKRQKKLDEMKAIKVLRACRSRRALANQL